MNEKKYFKLYIDTLEDMFVLILSLLRHSLKKWDTYDPKNVLRVVYGKKKTQSLLKYIKQ